MISAVGGMKEPPVDRFIAGYFAGAEKAAPGIETILDYSQDWDDQAKCKELALNQIARGSQVVFQVAGGCGLGALNAAGERGVWGIGVDADQSFLGPHILTSAQKGVDSAVFLTIEAIQDGSWKGGGNATFGLKEDGVGLGKVSAESAAGGRRQGRRNQAADRGRRDHRHPDRGGKELSNRLLLSAPRRLRPTDLVTDCVQGAAGDRGDDPDSRLLADGRGEVVSPLAVDIDVHERPHLAALVEHEVGHRERTQGLADRRSIELEPLLPARLGREQPGEEDDGHSDYCSAPASTERIGGRCRAASTISS